MQCKVIKGKEERFRAANRKNRQAGKYTDRLTAERYVNVSRET